MVWKNIEKTKTTLKQKLKVFAKKLKNKKAINERETINRQFNTNPKAVYRKFNTERNTKVVNAPTRDEIGKFWEGIWNNRKQYKSDAEWLLVLEQEYCSRVKHKKYNIKTEILKKLRNLRITEHLDEI